MVCADDDTILVPLKLDMVCAELETIPAGLPVMLPQVGSVTFKANDAVSASHAVPNACDKLTCVELETRPTGIPLIKSQSAEPEPATSGAISAATEELNDVNVELDG